MDGIKNPSADKVPKINKTWSDTNLDQNFDEILKAKPDYHFERLRCRECGGTTFEVLGTGPYETSARCTTCGMYYIVHTG